MMEVEEAAPGFVVEQDLDNLSVGLRIWWVEENWEGKSVDRSIWSESG